MPHPHMRGEYFHTSHPGMCAAGSSPRAWGIRPGCAAGRCGGRFIPTCVGNTVLDGIEQFFRFGSSPRAWGIQVSEPGMMPTMRFIPTCVGNTGRHDGMTGAPAVHPHVRGEYISCRLCCKGRGGSSPRAWGILTFHAPVGLAGRFIPTCVGNTGVVPPWKVMGSVHPHVRGEYYFGVPQRRRRIGSSPRAWGILHIAPAPDRIARFIPTCVGNTSMCSLTRCSISVHPHVRGEYVPVNVSGLGEAGSSPRAWGIRAQGGGEDGGRRFIPTCVGNTHKPPQCRHSGSVHPHVRGEYSLVMGITQRAIGSSPRAWGIRSRQDVLRSSVRFIPTCVGNTIYPPLRRIPRTVHPHVRGEYVLTDAGGADTVRFIPTCVGNTHW